MSREVCVFSRKAMPACDHAGAKTGRCPKDKRVVMEPDSQQDIWWSDGTNGSPNFEMDDRSSSDLICHQVMMANSISVHISPALSHSELEYISKQQQLSHKYALQVAQQSQHNVNCSIVFNCRTFKLNRERAVDYLNMLDRIYVFDGFAGWEPEVSLAYTIYVCLYQGSTGLDYHDSGSILSKGCMTKTPLQLYLSYVPCTQAPDVTSFSFSFYQMTPG